MWFWLVKAITGSILGNATSAWFEKTNSTANCTGYVNLSDLLSGKCKDVKIRVN